MRCCAYREWKNGKWTHTRDKYGKLGSKSKLNVNGFTKLFDKHGEKYVFTGDVMCSGHSFCSADKWARPNSSYKTCGRCDDNNADNRAAKKAQQHSRRYGKLEAMTHSALVEECLKNERSSATEGMQKDRRIRELEEELAVAQKAPPPPPSRTLSNPLSREASGEMTRMLFLEDHNAALGDEAGPSHNIAEPAGGFASVAVKAEPVTEQHPWGTLTLRHRSLEHFGQQHPGRQLGRTDSLESVVSFMDAISSMKDGDLEAEMELRSGSQSPSPSLSSLFGPRQASIDCLSLQQSGSGKLGRQDSFGSVSLGDLQLLDQAASPPASPASPKRKAWDQSTATRSKRGKGLTLLPGFK